MLLSIFFSERNFSIHAHLSKKSGMYKSFILCVHGWDVKWL